jgi:DNA-binding NarL/FixJ family response regulator
MATGLDSHQVAAQLGMPVEEVRRHVAEVLRHLGAWSRLDAVIKAAQRGLIEF